MTFGTLSFYGVIQTAVKKPSTYKVVVGKKIIEKNVVMRNAYEWSIRIKGYLTGQLNSLTVEQEKTALKALEDGVYRAFKDGEHDGNYIIPNGGLVIDSTNNYPTAVVFSLNLIEWKQ